MISRLLAFADNPFGNSPLQPASEAFSQGSADTPTLALQNAEHLLSNVLGILTVVASLSLLLYFILGGMNWITAGGEQGKVQKAREQMVHAVIGMVIVVIAYGVMGIVGAAIGINILQPAETIYYQLNPTTTTQPLPIH